MPFAEVDILNDVHDDSNNAFKVTQVTAVDSTNNAQRVTLATGLDSTNDSVTAVGNVAADGLDAGNPLKIGGRASAGVPTAVSASGDRVNAYFDPNGRLVVAPSGPGWTTAAFPGENATAIVTTAAAGGTIKNVALGWHLSLVGNTTAPTAGSAPWVLRDGATAAGTIKMGGRLGIPATAGFGQHLTITGLWIEGSANNAMTLEFTVASGANTRQTAVLIGTTVGP